MEAPLAALRPLEPWVSLPDGLYAKARRFPTPVALVTARNVKHDLRRLATTRGLVTHHQRIARTWFRDAVDREVTRRRTENFNDPLRYFVEYLVPAFQRRDWGEGEENQKSADHHPSNFPDPLVELEQQAGRLPILEIPTPSLGIWGRVWLLQPTLPSPGKMQVTTPRETLGLTGEYFAHRSIEEKWRDAVRWSISEAANRQVRQCVHESPALIRFRQVAAVKGFIECGDLLFLASSPPRLGHILPPHYNGYLNRPCQRDLALTVSLVPPRLQPSSLDVVHRVEDKWRPLNLPFQLCLGSGLTTDRPESPGLALAAYLRWAAIQVATNGKFHE